MNAGPTKGLAARTHLRMKELHSPGIFFMLVPPRGTNVGLNREVSVLMENS